MNNITENEYNLVELKADEAGEINGGTFIEKVIGFIEGVERIIDQWYN